MAAPAQEATWIATYQDGEKGHWSLTPEGRVFLSNIKQELSIISIAGAMRQGKSYIMNLLVNAPSLPEEEQSQIFPLGEFTDSKTKGVWGYVRNDDRDPKVSRKILLLDFEGMFDTERENANFDAQIFILAVLCSSYFIYNVMGVINNESLKLLGFVSCIGDNLALSSTKDDKHKDAAAGDDSTHSSHFPPHFLWVVRDFMLKTAGGLDSNGYMESILNHERNNATKSAVKELNGIRESIKENFKKRSCVFLVRPIDDEEKLQFVDKQPFSSLREKFRQQLADMLKEIMTNLEPKKIKDKNGATFGTKLKVNGKTFLSLFETLLNQLNTSSMFCIQDAWVNVSMTVTRAAFELGKEIFEGFFVAQCKDFPIEEKTMIDLVTASMIYQTVEDKYLAEAILYTHEKFGTDPFHESLVEIEKKYNMKNYDASKIRVTELLDEWIIDLESKLEDKVIVDNNAYIEHCNGFASKIKFATGSIGPAHIELAPKLRVLLNETDKTAVRIFKLSDMDIEVQKKTAETIASHVANRALMQTIETQELEKEAEKQRTIEYQEKVEKAHYEEIENTKKELSLKMEELAKETEEAIKRGDRNLQQQKEASTRDLSNAMNDMTIKNEQAINSMRLSHQSAINRMEESTQKLQNDMARAKKDADEQAAKHRSELEEVSKKREDQQKQDNVQGRNIVQRRVHQDILIRDMYGNVIAFWY